MARAQAAKTRLILLGTGGGPRPRKAASASSQVIVVNGALYVVDCGDGVARQIVSAGLSLSNLRHVFLTHSHRDHVGAWPRVRRAQFHVSADERAPLTGAAPHRGWVPKWADRLRAPQLPDTTVAVRTFARDTMFVFGADTLYAFQVKGHTSGSAA